MACVFVCVCRGRGVAGKSNAHAMSLDTWRTCLLNQKVRFVTGEVGDADSAHPPGGLALLAVWGVGGVEGGPLSGVVALCSSLPWAVPSCGWWEMAQAISVDAQLLQKLNIANRADLVVADAEEWGRVFLRGR